MHYFALLLSPESTYPADPADQAAEMAAYQDFHATAERSIRGGDALLPSATGVRITGGRDQPSVTDGPFAEGAEVAGGYYVFEADDLDQALGLAAQIPAAKYGAVEVWPMAGDGATSPLEGTNWLALLLEPPAVPSAPGSEHWQQLVAQHGEFHAAAGEHVKGGAGLHPPSTTTTVTVRDGKASFTDGPFAEGAEVANGFYVLSATDRDEAVKIASMIPATSVELRQLAGISGL
ncbi:transcription initiation protein [Mycobacterium antarcticum]|uniref:YciI family protein n=1 Tax=unclassified Mycolicibacterium TaxID=2636767 RepID=UPI0023A353B5|nr:MULTISPECIES: YciI family protein [unclassified Mycolicibacterium]BDX34238.1 transcription initiation protein [Mycolicibacterium sp. TUM20985]GLP77440.1 transcription initiation protein [Mycolicibacterium sp. TUM20983]GLP82156.1 transcription initiation protein [Mycolicibacterium sp. TUM20984]